MLHGWVVLSNDGFCTPRVCGEIVQPMDKQNYPCLANKCHKTNRGYVKPCSVKPCWRRVTVCAFSTVGCCASS